jgi:hypothetical protein
MPGFTVLGFEKIGGCVADVSNCGNVFLKYRPRSLTMKCNTSIALIGGSPLCLEMSNVFHSFIHLLAIRFSNTPRKVLQVHTRVLSRNTIPH